MRANERRDATVVAVWNGAAVAVAVLPLLVTAANIVMFASGSVPPKIVQQCHWLKRTIGLLLIKAVQCANHTCNQVDSTDAAGIQVKPLLHVVLAMARFKMQK